MALSLTSEPVPTFGGGMSTALAPADFYAVPAIRADGSIPITYTIHSPAGGLPGLVRAFYSPDGGGHWLPAARVTDTLHPALTGTYDWDVWASGFFGLSDDVVFRLLALPNTLPTANGKPGPFQWPYVSAQTYPFRVRGSQVRVLSGTLPVAGAMVYRLPANQEGTYQPYQDSTGHLFHTDPQGYLQGRGELYMGDRLVALLPITWTDTYTLYYTSAAPTALGLDPYTVTVGGVQTLTVLPEDPLILFNLDLSLEWDARSDPLFLDQLAFDLQRTSAYLYDWTNGQVALGQVTIYQDRQRWNQAHVRLYASNRMRPSAAQGGIVGTVLTDSTVLSITYAPGQVSMGAVWNRYGDPGGGISEDWPRTLAHELGHYALFLDDNYLGFDPKGRLIPVVGCSGAMSDPYREDYPYDEFHADDPAWLAHCTRTLSHQATGRADWATIETFYPGLGGPAPTTNTGPSYLPLAVTAIHVVTPTTPSLPLEDPVFYLVDAGGGQVQPGRSARAFLFGAAGDRLTDLGRPILDRVLARGPAKATASAPTSWTSPGWAAASPSPWRAACWS